MQATKRIITHPISESENDTRANFGYQMMVLALSKSGLDYELRPSQYHMTQNRVFMQLANRNEMSITWSMTSKERESNFLPVRIPLDKGLLGWRIFLINKKYAPQFGNVKTLADLQKFSAGQGSDWPDTEILRANGLSVQGNAKYDPLFQMLQVDRFQYFPRSIIEIWDEAKAHPNMNLQVEASVLLQYPAALYLFVHKDDHALADALTKGLLAAIADGSFERLFQQFHGDFIQRANLKQRTRLRLSNPLLPPETPVGRKEFWFDL